MSGDASLVCSLSNVDLEKEPKKVLVSLVINVELFCPTFHITFS